MSILNRLFGPPDVKKLAHEEDLPGLLKALRYRNDETIRVEAAKYLGHSGNIAAVEPLVAALTGDESQGVRLAAADALGEIGDPRATAALLNLLESQDGPIQNAAARALGKIGAPQAVEPLVARLQGPAQLSAVRALGQIKDPRAVAALIDCLNNGDAAVRQAAAVSLAQIYDQGAVAALLTRLRDKNQAVRRSVAEALEKLGWQPGQDETGAWYWIARQEWPRCRAVGDPAVKPLTLCLTLTDRDIQANAVVLLGELGEAGCASIGYAVEPLIWLLRERGKDAEFINRLFELIANGKHYSDYQWRVPSGREREKWQANDAQSLKQTIEMLKRKFGEASLASARAIGGIEGWQGLEKAVKNLRKENQAARRAILDALGQIGDPRAVEPLAAALADPDADLAVAAAQGLREIGDPAAAPALVAALKDFRRGARQAIYQNWKAIGVRSDSIEFNLGVNQAAARALESIGWQPDQDEAAAWYWLGRGEWERCAALAGTAVAPLVAALNEAQPAERLQAAVALGQIKDGRAVEALIVALGDWDVKLRLAAALALGQIQDSRAIEPLAATLDQKDKIVRAAALQALAEFGTAGRPALIQAVQSRHEDVRIAAIQALAGTGDPQAVAPLIAALRDPLQDVRLAAAQALGQFKDARSFEPLIAFAKTRVIQNPTDEHFEAASQSLAQISGVVAIEALLAHLDDQSGAVRAVIAQSLDQNGWQPGEDENGARYWIARQDWQAVIALGPSAVGPLLADLIHAEISLRRNAAQALGRIGDRATVEPLIAALKDKAVRVEAAQALGQIGDRRAIDPLAACLQDADVEFRKSAAQALEAVGWQPDGSETEAWRRIAQADWDGCVALRSAAVGPLIATLQLKNKAYQKGAAEALVQLYRSGGLSEADRLKVLNLYMTIAKPHTDAMHYSASDCGYHTDEGIGIEFPV